MLDIKDLILQLSEDDYDAFHEMLSSSKAEKSQKLLQHIRENTLDDKEIINELEVNSTAFYTLRSRLNDKLQDFMLKKVKGPKLEILEKVNNLDHILFSYPQKQAISIVEKLQEEMRKFDQPIYLLKIFTALKKLYLNSGNHYLYSQYFNQHITFLIDYDKNEDLMAELVHTIGEHMLSRDPVEVEKMHIIMQQIEELNSSYKDASRFYIIRSIAQIHYQIYLSEAEQQMDLEPVENIFQRAYQIIDDHSEDTFYSNLRLLFDYLSYEYYNKYGIRKKAQEYYLVVDEELPRFLNSYRYYAVPTMFLQSRMQQQLSGEELGRILAQNDTLNQQYDVSKDDVVNYTNFKMYLAACYFRAGDIDSSNHHLNELRNDVSFKNYPHAEIELKLMLATNYMLQNELELSNSLVKSVSRKISSLDYFDYPNVKTYRKLLQQALRNPTNERKGRMNMLINEFRLNNQNSYAILAMLGIDERFPEKLLP